MSRKIMTSILAFAAMAPANFGAAQSNNSIQIYSEEANPNKPITIHQEQVHSTYRDTASHAQIVEQTPVSTLNGAEELSPEDIAAMERVFKIVEDANTIQEIDRDDPLSGMSPDQRAFMEAMLSINPMTPEQIRMFREHLDASKRASREPLRPDAQRSSRSIDLTLKPGEETPTVRMEAGKVATLTFSDMNGNPWPILSVTTGDDTAFAAQTAGEQGESNILIINPKLDYTSSNMVVTLVDNPVPVIMTLDARDQVTVDYRTDIRIDGKGPNSDYAITDMYNLPPTGDSTMIAFLDGIPPKGAEKRKVSAGGVEAWVFEDQLYIRTKGQVFSPAFTAKSTNVSGVSVFALPQTPVVLISQDGTLNTVSVRP